MDSLIVGWTFGKRTPVETGHVLLNEVPLFQRWKRLRSRLRQCDLPAPIQRMKRLMEPRKRKKEQRMKRQMEPRKRKKDQRLKRPILMTKDSTEVHEWSPSLKRAVEAKNLRRKKFRALGAGEQALVTAFLGNCFPGKKFVYNKCKSSEYVTWGHLQRRRYMQKHVKKFEWQRPAKNTRTLVKMLKTAIRHIQK